MAFEDAVARGSDALKQGNLSVAQQQFREALDADPENVRVLALLGLTYFRGNQFAEARPIYESLVERAPTDASHRLNLGLVYLKLNESDKAIGSLEASRALDPSQGRAVSYLGLAYARAGRYAEAYRSFLLAGQNELATEIEVNLTAAERDGIHHQLGRTPQGPTPSSAGIAIPRTTTPTPSSTPAISSTPTPPSTPAISSTPTPASTPAITRTSTPPTGTPTEPRTKPPSAPPKKHSDPELSHPEIVIDKHSGPLPAPAVPMVPARSGASVVDPASVFPVQTPSTGELRMTDSQMFVLPKSEVPVPQPGVSMVSTAVAAAAPATAKASGGDRTKAGGFAPRPLSELATDELLRPEDGDDPFEISAGGSLIVRITDRVLTRLEGVHVTGGDLAYEIAMRRSRGSDTKERFDYGGTPLHAVSGHGYLIAVPGPKRTFSAVTLDDDILYLREDLVFAFEATLRWESGNVPGLRGKFPIVQFRGDGALAIRMQHDRALVRVKLPANGVVFIDADRLAGWIGRVIPRAVAPPIGGPMGSTCIECTGEGIVLVEPAPEPERASAAPTVSAPADTAAHAAPPPPPRTTPPPPPPAPAAQEIDPELDMSSVLGDDPIPEKSSSDEM
ncbi:MAG: tetratricopeptide repeat protein [Kofleriaceae bacterium]